MKAIFTNGNFDVLHIGHLRLLKYAASLGDMLIVCIDSDRRIKAMKGTNRPVNNENNRKEFLEAFDFVMVVKIFDTDEGLIKLVKFFNPETMVVGAEYEGKTVIGSSFAKNVVFFPRIEGFSSTSIINKCSENY